MAESNWKVRIILFARSTDVTPENKQIFGSIFANNGSGQTVEEESTLFDAAIRLSTSGTAPAQVFGIETALLFPNMRDDMRNFLDTLPQSRYYVVANINLAQYNVGEYIDGNGGSGVVGQLFTMNDALTDLFVERGLRVIE